MMRSFAAGRLPHKCRYERCHVPAQPQPFVLGIWTNSLCGLKAVQARPLPASPACLPTPLFAFPSGPRWTTPSHTFRPHLCFILLQESSHQVPSQRSLWTLLLGKGEAGRGEADQGVLVAPFKLLQAFNRPREGAGPTPQCLSCLKSCGRGTF